MSSPGNGDFSALDLVASPAGSPRRVVQVGEIEIGGEEFVIMAGPCVVETESQLLETAKAVCRADARILRGGAYKSRSSPYSFQGLGVEGLKSTGTAAMSSVFRVTVSRNLALTQDDVEIVVHEEAGDESRS